MAITKPTVGQTGWNTAVDAVIDKINELDDSTAARTLAAWTSRKRANYERDNATPFTIYVDQVNGVDTNTGASPAQAFKTLGRLTTAGTITAGARIGLARGSTFTGAFTVPAITGLSASSRVTFGAYGVGPAPIITGGEFSLGQPHVDLQDLHFTNSGSTRMLFMFNGTTTLVGNQIRRCELGPQTNAQGALIGVIGGLIEDCYIHDIWSGIEYPTAGSAGSGLTFTTGTDRTEVRYNLVQNCFKGLESTNTHRNLLIHHNIVDKCRVNGIDMTGGTAGAPPKIINNFVWHRPTTPNGHGIDTQTASVGPYWRNNLVYCDYDGTAGNVELYCIDSTSLGSTDIDYNLGHIAEGTSGASYGKLGTTNYATLSAFKTALNGTTYAGKEAHSVEADPQLADVDGGVFVPLPTSPAVDAGVEVGGVSDLYLGAAPDLGAYEVAP